MVCTPHVNLLFLFFSFFLSFSRFSVNLVFSSQIVLRMDQMICIGGYQYSVTLFLSPFPLFRWRTEPLVKQIYPLALSFLRFHGRISTLEDHSCYRGKDCLWTCFIDFNVYRRYSSPLHYWRNTHFLGQPLFNLHLNNLWRTIICPVQTMKAFKTTDYCEPKRAGISSLSFYQHNALFWNSHFAFDPRREATWLPFSEILMYPAFPSLNSSMQVSIITSYLH